VPRGFKRDNTETAARNFDDPRSFVSLDGHMLLYGEDYKAQRQRVFFRDRGICQYCYKPIDVEYEAWTADHITKRSDGGSDDLDNLRLIHNDFGACHQQRHTEFQTQFTKA